MTNPVRFFGRVAGNRRGAALPLALLGLVLVSVMMTAVLLSSTTEGAVSRAQRDAAAGLYNTESALQEYVAQEGTGLRAAANVAFPAGNPSVRIDVARLYLDSVPTNNTGEAIYSVRAQPTNGGRVVLAMVRIPYRKGLDLQPTSALTSGAPQIKIKGSSQVNGKQNRELCTTGADSVAAVTLTNDVNYDPNGGDIDKRNLDGAIDVVNYDRYELARRLFSPSSLDEIAGRADIKFGINGTPAFPSSGEATSENSVADLSNLMRYKFNWGCPADVMGAMGRTPCTQDADVNWYPVVAIDASRSGGTVSLSGDHGQGVLLILNGGLTIQGTFSYKGIIVVEGETRISGSSGSSGGAKIEGALIGFGDVSLDDPTNPIDGGDATSVLGNAVLSYNSCAIDQANQSLNRGAVLRRVSALSQPTFAWSEVVR